MSQSLEKTQQKLSQTAHRSTLRRLVGELLQDRVRVIFMLVTGALGVLGTVVGPKILGNATNVLFEGIIGNMLGKMGVPSTLSQEQIIAFMKDHGHEDLVQMISSMHIKVGAGIDWTLFTNILLLTLAIYLLAIFLRLIQTFLMTHIVSTLIYNMRRNIEKKIDRLPLQYFDRIPRGEIMSRTTNDVDNIQQNLQQFMGELLFSVFMVIGVFFIMLNISVTLTIISFIIVPSMFVVVSAIMRKANPHFSKQWETTGDLNALVEEMISGHMVVRAYGQEEHENERYDKVNYRLYRSIFVSQYLASLVSPIAFFFSNINYVIIIVYGGLKVLTGSMTIGDLQAFAQYTRQLAQPIGQLASMSAMIQSSIASAERIYEFLDEPEETQEQQAAIVENSMPHVRGHVKFNNIVFSYKPDEPLITDLSIEAKPGQTVAIVGPTGAGKTTLVNLLMRFYDIQKGSITIDDVNIQDVTRQELRSHFGMVLQDTWFFEGTIRENLLYGVHDQSRITDDDILHAARATHVDDFIQRLPNGYDTLISEDNCELSTGERQLLTICRAFLAQPDILILDEATSSVDTRTELLVQEAMNALRKNRTSFVIAHRLSTIRDADLILVVNHGSVVEQGSHEELLALHGAYASLYNAQFANKQE